MLESTVVLLILLGQPFTFFCPEGVNATVNKLEIKRDGQRKQPKIFSPSTVRWARGDMQEKRSQGWPPAPFRTRLGQTGILIRAAEYHCFIRRGSEHTHSHVFGHMRRLYTQTRGYEPVYGRCYNSTDKCVPDMELLKNESIKGKLSAL